ncbi:phage tail sheath subtilisin-like domain-containing protein [Pseudomonas sp. PDM14]|uniref:phage tail sheath family protein n=1 Tax=Pseudomonas sp. PDM14 TaxID=2769288 RepID=UPI00177B6460|nr:phage tail sheath C-terminal domain-containing protein [Pseudomonas sp. PDM14]MBD9482031.1 phage tail sheath subtilisin-like domain-containing protein [Pseudomonas sp. PDM14]
MPAQLSYPGVYIEELPSGVRTLTGVATSIAAFVGSAPRGPINRAVRLFSFADYERRFGGLAVDSEMGYAVRQFFQNGGTDAYAVRVVKDASVAQVTLLNGAGSNVLKVEALDAGSSGTGIEVRVDHRTAIPGSTFNITFIRAADGAVELYENLSLNAADSRYALDLINGVSQLVRLTRLPDQAALDALPKATSVSATLTELGLDANHNELRIAVNGLPPVTVVIALPADTGNGTLIQKLDNLCTAIQLKVRAKANNQQAYEGFVCERPNNTQTIHMRSGVGGEFSSVRVLPGQKNNASAVLKLGSDAGGIESDAAATIRPKPVPEPATLTSAAFAAADLDTLPNATHSSLRISLDGYGPDVISLGDTLASGANLQAKLSNIAARLQTAVRELKPANPAYKYFRATSTADTLQLSTGTQGAAASIAVSAAPLNSVAAELRLLTGSLSTQPVNLTLQGGSETAYGPADLYSAFIADRATRKGLYALESVDLFNILCLPGVTDTGVLMDAAAYCEERRAFFVIDAPPAAVSPEQMVAVVSGTELPKSDHAAVYYPWVYIADPLKNGKLRLSAPSGTIAGLYARTDGDRGVWKAPAGTEATLVGVQALNHALTDGENGSLNPLGVNCLRTFPVFGAVSWGARTLRGADQMTSEYKYVPIRRLALFLEESLYRGTQWVVFEPNDEPLWAQIRLNLGAFMNGLFRQGAFQGKTPREAYLVKCDRETTTQDDINRGVVNILVAFAPLKPAEFVVLKIQQLAGQIQV